MSLTNLRPLNSDKSLKYLKWKTILTAKEAIKYSLDWYKSYSQIKSKEGMIEFPKNKFRNTYIF